MSLIIVPDNILEKQICENCFRYLSVKPIKIGQHRIFCGRCTSVDIQLVESYYNVFIEAALFKCINHFDGCDKLLTCDQVVAHEAKCESEKWECLLCPKEQPKLPTYMLWHHVRTKHNKSLLKTNHVSVHLKHSQVNIFLYRKHDCLYFIEQSFDRSSKCITVKIVHSGGNASKILNFNFKLFLVSQDGNKVQFLSKNINRCTSTSHITVQNLEEDREITIYFDFDVPFTTKIIETNFSSLANINSINLSKSSKPFDVKVGNSYNLTLKELIARTLAMKISHGKIKCVESRLLRFTRNKKLLNWCRISDCETKLLIKDSLLEEILICFHCILCNAICKDLKNNFVSTAGKLRHLVCVSCSRCVSEFIALAPLSSLITDDIFKSVEFSCINKCYVYQCASGSFLPHYKNDCTSLFYGKYICCSFANCSYSSCNFDELKNHFFFSHDKNLAFVAENFVINLDLTKLPVEVYALYYDTIIKVSVEIRDNGHWISAEICDKHKKDNLIMYVFEKPDSELNYICTFYKTKIKLQTNKVNIFVRFIIL